MTESVAPNVEKKRNLARWQVIAVALIFTGPFIAAHLLNANLDRWKPSASKNGGSLVIPAKPLPTALPVEYANQLKGSWTLLFNTAGQCDAGCSEQLYNMRQARMAQGRQMHRIKGVLLNQATLDDSAKALLEQEHQGLGLIQIAPSDSVTVNNWLTIPAATSTAENLIYLVDPLGNLMMVYSAEQGARAIIDDLARLLKLSKIG